MPFAVAVFVAERLTALFAALACDPDFAALGLALLSRLPEAVCVVALPDFALFARLPLALDFDLALLRDLLLLPRRAARAARPRREIV